MSQLDWIGGSAPPVRHIRVSEHTRTLPAITAEQSRAKRRRGMERVQRKADEASRDWTQRAAEFLGWYAREIAKGQPFLMEAARELAAHNGLPPPPNSKAWGPAGQRAVRLGLIVNTGQTAATRCSNRSPRWLWRAA